MYFVIGFLFVLALIIAVRLGRQRAAKLASVAEQKRKWQLLETENREFKERCARTVALLEQEPPVAPYIPDPTLKGTTVRRANHLPLVIKYESSEGITTRPIVMESLVATIHWNKTITPISIQAFCLLREGKRTFFVSRIVGAMDVDSTCAWEQPARRIVELFGFNAQLMRDSHVES